MKAISQIPGILRCSTEIHCMIFESLSADDFYGLFWACKFLNEFTEPYLYSEIQLNWRKHSRPPRILSLVKSILSKPYRANEVKGLTLGKHGGESMRSIARIRDVRLKVDEVDLEQLIEVIKTFNNIDYGDFWIRQLRNGNLDAFVALLLCRLPNLIYFRLDPNFLHDSRVVGLVLTSTLDRDTNCGFAFFQRLQYVSFNETSLGRFRYKNSDPYDILMLFYFPNILCVSATLYIPIDFGWKPSSPPVISTLTSLDLDMVNTFVLRRILSFTTGLKILRWRWHHFEDCGTTIQYDDIISALSSVQNTLTTLTISAENEVVNESSSITVRGSLGGLVSFAFLERLEINLEFLVGSYSNYRLRYSPGLSRTLQFERIVPKNIEVLTLTDGKELEWQNHIDYNMVVSAVGSWLKTWKTSTPHLRSIRFLLTYDYQESDSTPIRNPYKLDRTMRQVLDGLSAQEGIEIEVRRIFRTDL
ncbi:hypothetical protein BOTCAL_0148g00210 [Botryotinia calthae]|uniref:F-box domain-containing protein n=1 Tax=Botryotinia calthae TaxID=38488 RepID=A0A4Y8D4Y6_9HELO|nr:hypothetical protein BOTCAL_0148g00210 [Botryotinia calthae]